MGFQTEMRPTFFQRFFARHWPFRLILLGGAVGNVVWTGEGLWPGVQRTVWGVASFGLLLLCAGLLGLLVAVVVAAMFLPALYQRRAMKNGAPYRLGDDVVILAGRHVGRAVRVRAVWADGRSVRATHTSWPSP
jgi:hypothetical protein